jgi:DNA-directed RNA polymerase subunit RPC12/RpoP
MSKPLLCDWRVASVRATCPAEEMSKGANARVRVRYVCAECGSEMIVTDARKFADDLACLTQKARDVDCIHEMLAWSQSELRTN